MTKGERDRDRAKSNKWGLSNLQSQDLLNSTIHETATGLQKKACYYNE